MYLKDIQLGKLPSEKEELTSADRYNEYIMTGLRTIWGVSLDKVEKEFGAEFRSYLLNEANKHIDQGLLSYRNNILTTTRAGKFLADGLASDLFFVDLD